VKEVVSGGLSDSRTARNKKKTVKEEKGRKEECSFITTATVSTKPTKPVKSGVVLSSSFAGGNGEVVTSFTLPNPNLVPKPKSGRPGALQTAVPRTNKEDLSFNLSKKQKNIFF